MPTGISLLSEPASLVSYPTSSTSPLSDLAPRLLSRRLLVSIRLPPALPIRTCSLVSYPTPLCSYSTALPLLYLDPSSSLSEPLPRLPIRYSPSRALTHWLRRPIATSSPLSLSDAFPSLLLDCPRRPLSDLHSSSPIPTSSSSLPNLLPLLSRTLHPRSPSDRSFVSLSDSAILVLLSDRFLVSIRPLLVSYPTASYPPTRLPHSSLRPPPPLIQPLPVPYPIRSIVSYSICLLSPIRPLSRLLSEPPLSYRLPPRLLNPIPSRLLPTASVSYPTTASSPIPTAPRLLSEPLLVSYPTASSSPIRPPPVLYPTAPRTDPPPLVRPPPVSSPSPRLSFANLLFYPTSPRLLDRPLLRPPPRPLHRPLLVSYPTAPRLLPSRPLVLSDRLLVPIRPPSSRDRPSFDPDTASSSPIRPPPRLLSDRLLVSSLGCVVDECGGGGSIYIGCAFFSVIKWI
ncbi:hypothetical protein C7M84_023070 [Penaeus vannamei]|uniref:Uncharacterized protein n=1 Tax=Penaeus vannamei TaxID=6689 RepID=A0A3R7Q1S2_PENVA|nr:hypothetical protein C7M84_023070 [Penaeus vannamei]